ncbi:MAG: RluA family pseudouridine synthase [Tannerella sp.]|jgi:23S rRNA pseudouridine1911/1915/1917 synthase|nr:RluA family pseudouridine synthase [Tannerella sp.]
MEIIYEDNHLIAVNKSAHEIVQGDKTGDRPLSESLKAFLKDKYAKPGNVFIGVIHRLDRPVTGTVVFAKTSKALQRMNEKFRLGEVRKIYWAIVKNPPPKREGELIHWLVRNEQQNKSYASDVEQPNAQQAILHYRTAAASEYYHLLEIELKTGRHHQIRCQLAKIGCPVRGDLKYGADHSNPQGGISLHARSLSFVHPVTRQPLCLTAPVPEERLWKALADTLPTENTPFSPDGILLPDKP